MLLASGTAVGLATPPPAAVRFTVENVVAELHQLKR